MEKAKQFLKEVLLKSHTGIQGFDEITGGGIPCGRPTLVCGEAGSGKTLFSMEFLVHGALQFNEPGVFMSFEESENELITNVTSLGFNLKQLIDERKILLDYVQVERSEIQETGAYDLDGLFIRLNHAIDSIGAKRVVLDTIESLFAGLDNETILRAELRRLFRWLKNKGVTVIVTGEKGDGKLTRQGMEEYVSDCVVVLDHRIIDQISTRRLRIAKYRGSSHGTNEYPFIIDEDGFSVMPITSLQLDHNVSDERISSGIPQFDEMLGGAGFFRGSTIMVSGTAGTGKTSMGAHFVAESCKRGEKVMYFAFEESEMQVIRNMKSIGIDLKTWMKKGLLKFQAVRPTFYGLEMHLAIMHREILNFQPQIVIVDPLNSFASKVNNLEVKALAVKLIDYLKSRQITGFFTSLTNSENSDQSSIYISSLIDTWILLRDIELNGERNRSIHILKSRGMAHSNQIREFILTSNGILLENIYVGLEGVLTGSSRIAQNLKDKKDQLKMKHEIQLKKLNLEQKRNIVDAQMAALKMEFEAEETALMKDISENEYTLKEISEDEKKMSESRKSN